MTHLCRHFLLEVVNVDLATMKVVVETGEGSSAVAAGKDHTKLLLLGMHPPTRVRLLLYHSSSPSPRSHTGSPEFTRAAALPNASSHRQG